MLQLLTKSVFISALLLSQGWAMDQRELTIKAAYLFRLSLFVEWPPSRLNPTGSEPMHFCVADDQAMLESLKTVLAGKSINQHKIEVIEVQPRDNLSACHLLYLPRHIQTPKPFLQAVASHPVLTVGETEAFYRQGGMIYLYNKENRIRFAINEQAAKGAGLELRAQLLHLADQPP
ncbi:YfiR family protein [Methylobacter sp. YRD-M1]|uniref:YfiR family protein n=1 Tax=Methylobacter sp. YRD-M1 TaxID=2911520 RepID=UPI00227B30BB|nr:YfiR family protein [Methylobacter sp. YRD-M1]WAK02892.1 YfiR family protein [Methylobacter sp. YRD-M1]